MSAIIFNGRAEHAPDIDLGNFGVEVLRIPGTNGDTRLTGGTPGFLFQTGGWNGIGNVDTGNPFQFRDNQYVANANLSWAHGPQATFRVITSTLNLAGRGTGTGGERQVWFAGRITF